MADQPTLEHVDPATLKPHPRNYRSHPPDQLEHIRKSIEEHGFYRNVVVAADNTILAGHGVVLVARQMNMTSIPIIRIDVGPDDPKAIKLLTGDNEIAKLAHVDDRELTQLLKEINELDMETLLGTGYNEMQLANLVMVTRPASEIEDFDAAAEWVGAPEHETGDTWHRMIVKFKTDEDRIAFCRLLGLDEAKPPAGIWYPLVDTDDIESLEVTV